MEVKIHRITSAQFARFLMREVRRRRTSGIHVIPQRVIADRAGYGKDYVCEFETGRRPVTLRQALDCLEATAAVAAMAVVFVAVWVVTP